MKSNGETAQYPYFMCAHLKTIRSSVFQSFECFQSRWRTFQQQQKMTMKTVNFLLYMTRGSWWMSNARILVEKRKYSWFFKIIVVAKRLMHKYMTNSTRIWLFLRIFDISMKIIKNLRKIPFYLVILIIFRKKKIQYARGEPFVIYHHEFDAVCHCFNWTN